MSGRARAVAAAHPRHVVLAAFVLALPASRWTALATASAVVLAPLVARRRVAMAVAIATLAGLGISHMRLAQLEHSALAVQAGESVSGRATLLEHPRAGRFGQAVALVRFAADGAPAAERVLVRGPAQATWTAAAVGSELYVAGTVRPADKFTRARGAHAIIRARVLLVTGGRRGGMAGGIDAVRRRAEESLSRGVPAAHAALLRGMVLGDDHGMSAQSRDAFRAAGMSHLTAASGQNVLLLSLLTLAAATVAGLPVRPRLFLVLGVTALYVPLAGAGPSIQRAAVMGALSAVAALAGRPASRWYAVVVAAAATLVADPRAAADPGWQLSFAAVAAILAVARRWTDALTGRGLHPGVAAAAAVTVAAALATAPIVAWHFGTISLVSPVANLLAAPAVPATMWLGMVAAVIGQVSAAAATPLTMAAGVPAGYLSSLAGASASLPAATIAVPAWAPAGACLAVAGLLLARSPRVAPARRVALAAALAVVAAGVVLAWAHRSGQPSLPSPNPDHLRVTFLDVGQGDATLVQDGRAAVLVDAGPRGGRIMRHLRAAGVRRLDVLVVTHAQADHVGGAADVVRDLPVGLILDGRDGVPSADGDRLAREAALRRVRVLRPDVGQALRIDRLDLRVLWPPAEPRRAHAGTDPNGRAIVLLARAAGVRALLTADTESDVIGALPIGAVDVLKVAHHGSGDAGLRHLLRRLRPKVAVISVGAGNRYGQPAPGTVAALARAVPATYRTDRDGTVRVDAAPGRLIVHAG